MLPSELTTVCRLCLITDQVDVNIFENDSKDIYYRISTCLPVTITIEDKLPKRICSSCVDKVNAFYDFWTSTLNAEKHLLSWLNHESTTSSSICKSSQPYSYSCISEENDSDTNNHCVDVDSDENNVESHLENNVDKRRFDMKSKETDKPKSNQILNVDYQDEKPGPSGFQVEHTSALKQLQGLGEELIYLYVESEEQASAESEFVSPLEKYYRNASNPLNLLFDNDPNQHSVTEIEESSHADVSKSNIEQTSTYSVEFPQSDRFADVESKFSNKKRAKTNDTKGSSLYLCEICAVSFSDKTDYHKHELIHYVDYPYECAFCGDRFKRYKQLKNHKMYNHEQDLSEECDSSAETDQHCNNTGEVDEQSCRKSTCGELRSNPTKSSFSDLSKNFEKICESSGKLERKVDRRVQSLKLSNKEDVHVCEACGQTFSPSSIHKCLKLKPHSCE